MSKTINFTEEDTIMNTVTLPTFSSIRKKENNFNTSISSSDNDENENPFCTKNYMRKNRSSVHSSFEEADIKVIHNELMNINKLVSLYIYIRVIIFLQNYDIKIEDFLHYSLVFNNDSNKIS